MEKQKHGPVQNHLKRSLAGEFDHIGGVYEQGSVARHSFKLPAEPAHGTTPAPVTAIPPPGTVTDHGAIPQVQPSMESNGTGWPEARPMLVLGSNTPQSTHMYCESTSGSQNQLSLSLSPQYSVGWPVGVPVYRPQLLPVQPAYCFHCLQFGTVYTINPA